MNEPSEVLKNLLEPQTRQIVNKFSIKEDNTGD